MTDREPANILKRAIALAYTLADMRAKRGISLESRQAFVAGMAHVNTDLTVVLPDQNEVAEIAKMLESESAFAYAAGERDAREKMFNGEWVPFARRYDQMDRLFALTKEKMVAKELALRKKQR